MTNAAELKEELRVARRHINTSSDSEILLNVLAHELDQQTQNLHLEPEHVFAAVSAVHKKVRGAYAVVAAIIGHGMLAFRDPNGIRPLALGKRECEQGGTEYMVASESVALNAVGFQLIRDVALAKLFILLNKVNYSLSNALRSRSISPVFLNTCTLLVPTPLSIRYLCTRLGHAWARSSALKLPESGKTST